MFYIFKKKKTEFIEHVNSHDAFTLTHYVCALTQPFWQKCEFHSLEPRYHGNNMPSNKN